MGLCDLLNYLCRYFVWNIVLCIILFEGWIYWIYLKDGYIEFIILDVNLGLYGFFVNVCDVMS